MDFAALIAFLAELSENNAKPWFDEHRPTYERLRDEWIAFVGQVIDGISQFDPSVGIVSPKDALFRINRDIRFSKDKRPYKTTFSAAICPQGRTSGQPAYYFQVAETGELMIAGGVYMPEPATLARSASTSSSTPSGCRLSWTIRRSPPPSARSTGNGSSARRRGMTRRRPTSSSSS